MDHYDFPRSYITFGIDLDKKKPVTLSQKSPTKVNNARVVVECVCTITNQKEGASRRYVLDASCKTELVGVSANIWTEPNADMCLVGSSDEFMIVKSWAKKDMGVMLEPATLGPQPERHASSVEEVFTRYEIALCRCDAEVLDSPEAIVEATLSNRPLTARIEYEEGDYHVCIDHPVKTMNASPVDTIFQTDTGPVLLPDLSDSRVKNSERFIEVLDLAYAACNCFDWVEFIVNVPTPLTDEISVNHYSRSRRIVNTKNTIYELL
jgi:hypothetical protein